MNRLPCHGRLQCNSCYQNGATTREIGKWQMRNDPGAWGSETPKVLVLGFSKGATQADIFANGSFDDVAFGHKKTRGNLTRVLQVLNLIGRDERVDDRIKATERDFHFASLVRCSLARLDEKATAKNGAKVYRTSGELVPKAFREVPEIIRQCAGKYLAQLPTTLKLVLVLGTNDAYIKGFKEVVRDQRPSGFRGINQVAYRDEHVVWCHVTHPSRGNGHFTSWIEDDTTTTAGMKKQLALHAILEAKLD